MKFILTPIIALICGVAAYGQNLTKYELKVGEFNELKVVDGINVDYK